MVEHEAEEPLVPEVVDQVVEQYGEPAEVGQHETYEAFVEEQVEAREANSAESVRLAADDGAEHLPDLEAGPAPPRQKQRATFAADVALEDGPRSGAGGGVAFADEAAEEEPRVRVVVCGEDETSRRETRGSKRMSVKFPNFFAEMMAQATGEGNEGPNKKIEVVSFSAGHVLDAKLVNKEGIGITSKQPYIPLETAREYISSLIGELERHKKQVGFPFAEATKRRSWMLAPSEGPFGS